MEGYVVGVFALVCMAIGFFWLFDKTMNALIWVLKRVRWLKE